MASVWVEESTRIRSGGVEAGIGMHGLIVLPAIADSGAKIKK